MKNYFISILWLAAFCQSAAADPVLLREEFENLERWQTYNFKKIDKPSEYSAVSLENGASVLRAESKASASGLVLREPYSLKEYPVLKWRWKVENIYSSGDARSRAGDDYPIRVYVFFPYNPDTASLGMRIKYGAAKLIQGEYPPHSSLIYIWSNRKIGRNFIYNAYTDRAVMYPLDQGNAFVGTWRTHQRNVADDYRAAFGEEPPRLARLAIMNDSDNTEESSVSFLDYIEVAKQ